MEITGEHKKAINNNESTEKLREIAIKNNMITLGKNCAILVEKGITTLDELARISYLKE
jgi:type IV pilus assembly protein PilB